MRRGIRTDADAAHFREVIRIAAPPSRLYGIANASGTLQRGRNPRRRLYGTLQRGGNPRRRSYGNYVAVHSVTSRFLCGLRTFRPVFLLLSPRLFPPVFPSPVSPAYVVPLLPPSAVLFFFRPSPCFLPRRPLLAPFFRRHSLRTHPSYFSYFFRCRNRPDRSSPARKDIPCPRQRHRRGTQCRGGIFVFRSKTGSFSAPKKSRNRKTRRMQKNYTFPLPPPICRAAPALMPRRQPPAEYKTTAKNTRSSAVFADLTSSVREKMRR